MKFFLPDWDDRVDPGYDFQTDRFSLVRDPYNDDMYAHELLSDRLYDGLLVSRMALLNSGPKRAMVDRVGMRQYLRLPPTLDLLGDCGAFGYLRDKEPRFETDEVADYYERLDFDFGVSVDHAIVPEFESERQFRFDLTLRNAQDFLALHQKRGYRFTPLGACQGWDVHSYISAARSLFAMGYKYIALGGLARSDTQTIAGVVTSVAEAVPPSVRIHVFGVARLSLLPLFLELGIESVDSAAPLRQAWLSASDNYYAMDRTYAAIRIPTANDERAKGKTLVGRSSAPLSDLSRAEKEALKAMRAYARGRASVRSTLDAVLAYDDLLALRRDGQTPATRKNLYESTLRDRPWKACGCGICRELGAEVIIFRGNNRNRRRGFHNLYVVRQRIDRLRRKDAQVGGGADEGRAGFSLREVAVTRPLPIPIA
jgi:hypothetical protein